MPVEFFTRLKRHPNAWIRRAAGVALIVGGILGFLPILGVWMLPLGVVLISDNIPWLRRRRRGGCVAAVGPTTRLCTARSPG